jgi:hypothetical protein
MAKAAANDMASLDDILISRRRCKLLLHSVPKISNYRCRAPVFSSYVTFRTGGDNWVAMATAYLA